jgi:hypothetical protein
MYVTASCQHGEAFRHPNGMWSVPFAPYNEPRRASSTSVESGQVNREGGG